MPIAIDFSRLPEGMNKAYLPLLTDKHRYQVLKGGASSGKSVAVVQALVDRVLAIPRSRIFAIRKVKASLTDSCIEQVLKFINEQGLNQICSFVQSPPVITFINGSKFIFRGLDDVEKLKSIVEPDVIWIEEATEITAKDLYQLGLRLRGAPSVRPRQIILSFNPVSHLSFLKARFFDHRDDRAKLYETTYLDNRFLDPDARKEIEELINLDYQYYRVYALNEWGELKGIIYDPAVMHQSYSDYPNVFEVERYGLDVGFTDPMALYHIGSIGNDDYITELIYRSHLTDNDLVAECKRLGVNPKTRMACDSAAPMTIECLKRAGFNAISVDKGKDSVIAGIKIVKQRKQHTTPDNVNYNSERAGYKWRETRDGQIMKDEPIGLADHAMDSTRYATWDAFGKPPKKLTFG